MEELDRSGHRKRFKNKYINADAAGFSDVDLVELLLYYSIKRSDTKPVADKLLKSYGGDIDALFSADAEELAKIPGAGESSAELISFVNAMNRDCFSELPSVNDYVYTPELPLIKRFAVMFCRRLSAPGAHLIILDNGAKYSDSMEFEYDKIYSSGEARRALSKEALDRGCANALVIQYRGIKSYVPSEKDVTLTEKLIKDLTASKITLLDHVIVSEYGSLSMSGDYRFCELF